MINSLVNGIQKLFGNKADKDVKGLEPFVGKINTEFSKLQGLSNDELREKTTSFKKQVNDYLSEIDKKIADLKSEINNTSVHEIDKREDAYEQIDSLEEERDEKLEEVLIQILPEAFAVVKETARRFTENDIITASATEYDRDLAAIKPHINIKNDEVVYDTTWDAAGQEVSWNMIHYDVQLIGGVVLHQGKIAEMQTGEGKTLVSTLPAYLNALGQRGVHIVTVNDYLARRDTEWNAPIFQFHGLKVDCLDYYRPHSPERKEAYLADITYGTNNEFGFDYLRDNMAHSPDEQVQQKHHFAMIDEVDSVLIDDARTPLIISGPTPKGDIHEFNELKPKIQKVVDAQKRYLNTALSDAKKLIKDGKTNEKEGGLLLYRNYRGFPKNKPLIKFLGEQGIKAIMTKSENYYLQDQQKEMHIVDEELYFTIDEKNNQVELTDKGIDLISENSGDKDFFILPDVGSSIAELEKSALSDKEKQQKKDELMRDFSVKSERVHSINQLLKAYAMFEKDVEYIIQDGKVKIVDEQTGRVMDGRRYSDGLHQAIEAKENVKVEAATQTFATITLQNFFRMYHKLSGMTGTAETEAGELWEIYKLDVVVIPTNRPIARDDREDLVYKTVREKFNAVAEEIVSLQKEGRPVLVGTTSVEISELLSRMLNMRKIKHNVLNAKQHQREADIVAEAGQPGSVTLATNMAGRGTDIKLGKGVKDAGGLAIIGTERHDSRRVDRQLRGRAGRQGDPGSSQFFVSLEDNLMRLFGSDRVSKVMDRFGYEEGEVIQHSMISKTIERSQKKVEQNNFGIRKRLLEYDDVMNKQRVVIYTRRKNALYGDRLSLDINNALYDWVEENVNEYKDLNDYHGLKSETLRHLAFDLQINEDDFNETKPNVLTQNIFDQLLNAYDRKNQSIKERALVVFNKINNERGEEVKNILVPFSDGKKSLNVSINLQKAIETNGGEIINAFERYVALASIDENWKDHLRELDDLKQSANNASIEQKDPLLIYKLESFNLFQSMISSLNAEITSILFKGDIATQDSKDVREAKEIKRPENRSLKTSRASEAIVNQNNGQKDQDKPKETPVPVRAEQKVGRNDNCPCGSGKKYKKCHGKNS
ncbi:MAG: preprotein translocase subunit SecA [Bacteroidia bacterium]|nr:preprotein translocase subunit SecA [Bacteroidia bacterium]|tara:strand:- start:16547 stop:19864 length:3318 start_codon:yes stop_codon:yes gene_type:complete